MCQYLEDKEDSRVIASSAWVRARLKNHLTHDKESHALSSKRSHRLRGYMSLDIESADANAAVSTDKTKEKKVTGQFRC
jgi:hypothetical protein